MIYGIVSPVIYGIYDFGELTSDTVDGRNPAPLSKTHS